MGPMDTECIIRSSKVAMSQRNGTQTCYYSELGFVAVGQDGNDLFIAITGNYSKRDLAYLKA